MELSPRQREILEFVNSHVDEHGYPPTVREIGQAVGLTSPSTVHAHLARLEAAGLIRRDPTKPRALEVIEGGRSRERMAPAVAAPPARDQRAAADGRRRCRHRTGRRRAGRGHGGRARSALRGCRLPAHGQGREHDQRRHPSRRLRGRSQAGRRPQRRDRGRLVGDEDATVKRFFRESGRVRLQPENDEMDAMYPEQVRILGTVKAVLRRL